MLTSPDKERVILLVGLLILGVIAVTVDRVSEIIEVNQDQQKIQQLSDESVRLTRIMREKVTKMRLALEVATAAQKK
jgi:hypothetical protein